MDQPIALETFVSGSTAPEGEFSYHADHLGSVRFLTNEVGEVVNEYDYDAYGRPEILQETVAQPFLYTGREWEPDSLLYHYRARAYDPLTGKFFQEDPIWFAAGDLNVHRYVWNNPLNFTDPSGLSAGAESGAQRGASAGTAPAVAKVGRRVECLFNITSSAIDVATSAAQGSVNGGAVVDIVTDAAACAAKPVKACPAKRGGPIKRFFAAAAGFFLSFPEDTPILTPDGMVAIQDLMVGDLVLSRDEETGEMVFAPVADVFSRVTSEMTVLQLQTEDGIRTLRLTPEHPAYVDTMGWVQARMLAPGDEILDYDGSTPLTVISNTYEETTERVYNFEVEGTHNYFAGDVGAWVHNAKGGKNSSAGGVSGDVLRQARQLIHEHKRDNGGVCTDRDIDDITASMNLDKGPLKSLRKTLMRSNSQKRKSRGF